MSNKGRTVWGRLHIKGLGAGERMLEGTFQTMCERDGEYIGEPIRVFLSPACLTECLSTYRSKPAFYGKNQDDRGFLIDGYFRVYTVNGPVRITLITWVTSHEQED